MDDVVWAGGEEEARAVGAAMSGMPQLQVITGGWRAGA